MLNTFGLLTILMLCTTTAHAGAWMREKEEYFIAAGGNFLLSEGAQLPVHYDPTLYLEYGFSEKLTLGIDLHVGDAGRVQTGFIFGSFPIGELTGQQKLSANLGFGVRTKQSAQSDALMRAGLSWGLGLDHGWWSVDAAAIFSKNDQKFRPKIDLTGGHRLSDKWEMSVQIQTGQGVSDDYYAKIVPSATYNLRDNIKLHLGAAQALTGDRGAGLKFQTWITF